MRVVATWTGRHAIALKQALRLTNEGFAERIGTAVRTVAKWSAQPGMGLTPDMQAALDTLLVKASEDSRERFALLLASRDTGQVVAPPRMPCLSRWEKRLHADADLSAAVAWLDQAAGWAPGEARRKVASLAATMDPLRIRDEAHRRARVDQRDIAVALEGYYAIHESKCRLYRATCGGKQVRTSVVTQRDWSTMAVPLGGGSEQLGFTPQTHEHVPAALDIDTDAAAQRLAEALTTNTRLVDAPIYRLLSVGMSGNRITGSFALSSFLAYALTVDLLENETVDAITAGIAPRPGNLPLRDRYLPNLEAIATPHHRLCAGGPLALCAIARPESRSRRGGDYLLLVQERSGRVLNAARRLAVIPKAFHEPLVDYADDAAISKTLVRELEEELFGREDVDSVLRDQRGADPMHPTRLSEPMRWLTEHPDRRDWHMECTGIGYNLVSGNYEFASLIMINNESWWTKFGGMVEANWESAGLRTVSSRDRDLVASLIHDPSWSNEGLFAFLQGLRRLPEIGGSRVDLPHIETETA